MARRIKRKQDSNILIQAPDGEKIPIWLVWALHKDGQYYLRSVTTSQTLANKYRKALTNVDGMEYHKIVRVHIETREANHLYGAIGL